MLKECDNEPTKLENGNMNCEWEDEETHVCRPTCNDGYEFDSDLFVNKDIVCGPETGYLWNIKNADNPDGNIPSCQGEYSNKTELSD